MHLCNSIFVRKRLCKAKAVWGAREVPLPTADGTFVPRSAVVCTVNGICIANVHLTGGRYDDLKAHLAPDIKDQQLRYLVDACDPDVIVGDFNGQPELTSAVASYVDSFPEDPKLAFSAFFTGGHAYLRTCGYRHAAPRSRRQPVVTSVFGTCPDWIYCRSCKLVQRPFFVYKVSCTTAPVLSDHDALLACVAVHEPICRLYPQIWG